MNDTEGLLLMLYRAWRTADLRCRDLERTVALLREPHCGVCWDRSHAWGLCRKHYDELRANVLRGAVENDEATTG